VIEIIAKAKVVERSAFALRRSGRSLYLMVPTPGNKPNQLLITMKIKKVVRSGRNSRASFLDSNTSENKPYKNSMIVSKKRERRKIIVKVTIKIETIIEVRRALVTLNDPIKNSFSAESEISCIILKGELVV